MRALGKVEAVLGTVGTLLGRVDVLRRGGALVSAVLPLSGDGQRGEPED